MCFNICIQNFIPKRGISQKKKTNSKKVKDIPKVALKIQFRFLYVLNRSLQWDTSNFTFN